MIKRTYRFQVRMTEDEIRNYKAFCKKYRFVPAKRVRNLMEADIRNTEKTKKI
jgi:hypothetical protein